MEFKLNEQGIETYVSALTNKLIADFFSRSNYVEGKDIITFSSYEQVNFFILKNLFSDWQVEMTRLKSPYFDYEDENVQNALNELMNNLSHHIKIQKDDFEGLLYNSIYDTIELVCNPKEFVLNSLFDFPTDLISFDELKGISKYIKTNSHYFDKIIKYYTNDNSIVVKELKLYFNSIHEQSKEANLSIDSFVGEMSIMLPVTKSDFLIVETVLLESEMEVENIELEAQDNGNTTEVEQTIESLENSEERKKNVLEFVEDPESLEIKTLNDNFLPEELPETLHDKLSGNVTENLASDFQHKSVRNIKDSIGLNQKFMFQKRLFSGSNDDYEFAFNRLDDFETYEDVSNFLIDQYAQKYSWNEKEKEVSELFQLIAKKF